MNKHTEDKKKKRKSILGKLIAFLVILAISIACSNYNFVEMGHDFFMGILSIATGQRDEESVDTEKEAASATKTTTDPENGKIQTTAGPEAIKE